MRLTDNWNAVPKAYLTRPSDECQAMAVLMGHYQTNQPISERSFGKQWGWSREKTRRFLRQAGVEIIYPKGKQNPHGGRIRLLPENNLNPEAKKLRLPITEES